jgi:hypothetical protein
VALKPIGRKPTARVGAAVEPGSDLGYQLTTPVG